MAVRFVVLVLALVIALAAAPVWLPALGTALAEDDSLQAADVALVLEGTGRPRPRVAEAWRQQGLVRDVVIVEAPVKTHALVAYWSDFVEWGLASPSPTPASICSVVRAPIDAGRRAGSSRIARAAARRRTQRRGAGRRGHRLAPGGAADCRRARARRA